MPGPTKDRRQKTGIEDAKNDAFFAAWVERWPNRFMTPDVDTSMELQSVSLPPLSEATRASLEAVRRAQEAARERGRRETMRARIGVGMVVGVIATGVIVLGPSLKRKLNAARAATTSPALVVAAPAPVPPAPAIAAAAPAPTAVAPAPVRPAAPSVAAGEPAGLPGQALLAPALGRAGTASAGDVDRSKCAETFEQHRWQISIDECTRLFEARPTDATLALRIAHAHHARSHFADAGTWANRAIALDPNLAEGFVLVARAESRAGRPATAVQAYRQYLTLAPRGWHAAEARAAVRAAGKAPHAQAPGSRRSATVQVAASE